MKKLLLPLIASLFLASPTMAKKDKTVAASPVTDNWYVQLGMDMSLQRPYNESFKNVFPKGWSLGVDAALGHWFTPEIGMRGRINWENGIGFMKNRKNEWLKGGKAGECGKYLSMVGDIQFDLHNLIWGYKADRLWNLQVFPRAGFAYNFSADKGSPLIGVGVGSTFRLSDRWKLYVDATYQAVTSGFTGKNTDTGMHSNGFFDFNVGIQLNLGKSGFQKHANATDPKKPGTFNREDGNILLCRSFWRNWYVRLGADIALQHPYEHRSDIGGMFTKGRSSGIDVAIGKWFSPEIGLRLRLNWENGLLNNSKQEWLAPLNTKTGKSTNHKGGGYVVANMDVPLSIRNIFWHYRPEARWDALVIARAGLISNRATNSASPLVGAGFGTTYRLKPRWSLYGEATYQVTTSEFYEGVSWTGKTGAGRNGFLSLEFGAQFDL